jgi:hypothetical protein
MKRFLTALLCLLTIAVFSIAFADSSADTGQKDQPKAVQNDDADRMMQEAKRFPSTLITDEERTDISADAQEIDVNPWQARYEDIPSNTE